MEELERKVLVLNNKIKQLENENEQLKQKMIANDSSTVNLKSIKSNKLSLNQNLDLDLIRNIKLENGLTINQEKRTEEELIFKNEIIDDDESMQNLQNDLVILATNNQKFNLDDDDEDLDDEDDDF